MLTRPGATVCVVHRTVMELRLRKAKPELGRVTTSRSLMQRARASR
jgi:hypothetical protein